MSHRSAPRPGGRSARIQRAVHEAASALLSELPRDEVTVARIAERAEVDPTTIYRRWGTVAQLFSDVAANRIREASVPESTGSLRGDLTAWARVYGEELSSGPGRGYLAEALAGDPSGDNARQCADHSVDSISLILERFPDEPAPTVDEVLERVIAPLIYRILFAPTWPLQGYAERLVNELLSAPRPPSPHDEPPCGV
ncbi:TetR/AcrR family transcriptional regulator [Citricoccus sp. GCM10030269]|uniref:TetR/AcrR family transcriptional regulator n=1 Tax=Citricoccus sp. GCM10030269 TaxID=3273388 RepID=UPI00360AC183